MSAKRLSAFSLNYQRAGRNNENAHKSSWLMRNEAKQINPCYSSGIPAVPARMPFHFSSGTSTWHPPPRRGLQAKRPGLTSVLGAFPQVVYTVAQRGQMAVDRVLFVSPAYTKRGAGKRGSGKFECSRSTSF